MDNIIELAPYLKPDQEEDQEPSESLEGVVVVEFNKSECQFRIGFSDDEENFKELTPDLIDVTICRLFDIIEILCDEFNLDY